MILYWIYVTIIVLVLFGAAIFAHELGHFLTARWFGMVIEVFSLGFGPPIWQKKHRGILYKIGVFPIGGYVALPQMDPTDARPAPAETSTDSLKKDQEATPPPKALPYVAPWKKIIVAAAGAGGNMVLAIIIAWIVYWIGKPSTPAERSAVVGFVDQQSAAYTNGLRIGDEILAVNDIAVRNWHEVIQENSRFEVVRFTVRTPSGTNVIRVPTEQNTLDFRMVEGLGPVSLCKVMGVEPDSSAAQAGIQHDDIIRTFNSNTVLSIEHLIALVSARPEQPTPLTVERKGQILALEATPLMDATLGRARIGIRFDPMAVDYDQIVHIPPSVQIKNYSTAILRVLRALLTPSEARATSQGLGGPPMIIYMIQDAVRKGIMIALGFMCFINVNLAIINLVPFPVLDGGHIVFSIWELATRRRVHPKLIAWLYQFCFALLIAAIILLSGRDFKRLYHIMRISKLRAPAATSNNTATITNALAAETNVTSSATDASFENTATHATAEP
jgi:regulator of sigma E protease